MIAKALPLLGDQRPHVAIPVSEDRQCGQTEAAGEDLPFNSAVPISTSVHL